MSPFDIWIGRREEFAMVLGQHLLLVLASTAVAFAIGFPMGLLAARRPRLGGPVVAAAGVVQTIPSLALFGILIPLPLIGGVGARTALVALVLYALLPIVRTTVAGLHGIDRTVLEAADALGMTRRQRLVRVELPLALPHIVAGLRVATVTSVGTATIAAAVGAGGLGEYIFRGLSMVNAAVILAGAIPAAALAVIADGMLALAERALGRRQRPAGRGTALVAAAMGAALATTLVIRAATGSTEQPIVVGSKNFTEQVILGELLAQAIERDTRLRVERKLNLGGTIVCEQALRSGAIDVYVEYTGTALTAVFGEPISTDPTRVLARVRQRYRESGRTVVDPLGFDNTFALLVRGDVARSLGLRTISDAVPHARSWRAGFGYEFLERADGFSGLSRAYGLLFREPPRVMDLTLSYRALAAGEVDMIAGDATSGLIAALDLARLEDNHSYFPPYHAVPVASTASLERHPELLRTLRSLGGAISEPDMRRLNAAVDVEKRDVRTVVAEFLNQRRP